MLRVLIADDEEHGRASVRRLLRLANDVEVVAECASGDAVLEEVSRREVDVVFLDIHMPGADGLEVASELGRDPGRAPAVVFVTAFDQHAVEAFERQAVDYLLKPVKLDRMQRTLERLRRGAHRGPLDVSALERDRAAGVRSPRVALSSRGRTVWLAAQEIRYVESRGNYVRVYAGEEPLQFRSTLTEFERQLVACDVLRIHRTCLVNPQRVRLVQSTDGGGAQVELDDGTVLPVGRTYRSAVFGVLRTAPDSG